MQKTIVFILLYACMLHLPAFSQEHRYDPPWNPVPDNDLNFTVKGIDNVPDIHGDITDPQLVVFMGGNQFMVVDELVNAFKKAYPEYQRILVETLPPGLLMQQIQSGSLVIGNMRITEKPDIYTAGKKGVEAHANLFQKTVPYASNKLALMVAAGNPKKIRGLRDLAAPDIRISMPDKKIEGIGETVETSYRKAGGDTLHNAIMVKKLADSTTFLTQIHHRQSPLRILYHQSDVAPVWETEVLYQQRIGHPVDLVPVEEKFNANSVSVAGVLKNAPHKEAANLFLTFLTGDEAKAIFEKYGFAMPATSQ